MKNICSLSILILSLFISSLPKLALAQFNGVQSPMINLPPAPEAAGLKEYVDIPVSEYTGTASVNIPLYTLQTKEISIPISVGYHSAGNRVTEEASWVGLGWSLNAGGVITREIKDKDDFGFKNPKDGLEYPGYYSNFSNQIDQLPGLPTDQPLGSVIALDPIEQFANHTIYFSDISSTDNYIGNDGNTYTAGDDLCKYSEIDAEPDLFSFNFMGYSGKFVLNDNGIFTPLSNHGLKITYENPGWKIIAQDGTSFLFGTADESIQKTYSLPYHFSRIDPNSSSYNYSNCANCSSPNNNTTLEHISSWFLKEIQTVNGRTINFSYDKEEYVYPAINPEGVAPVPGFSENWLKIYQSCFADCGVPTVNPIVPTDHLTASVSVIHYDRVDLKRISSSASDIRETITFHTADKPRLDLKGGKTLDRIEVKIGSELLKKIIFKTDYFTSTAPSYNNNWLNLVADLPNANNLVDNSNNLLRLKLNQIEICGQNDVCLENPYSFTYNNVSLPAKTSMSQDYWGYYNGRPNKTLIPSIYYVRQTAPPTAGSCNVTCSNAIDGCAITSIRGGNRKADEVNSQACILEKVVSPLGGSTEFNYETHQFANTGDDLKFNSALNEIGFSLVSTFNCLGDPNCEDPPFTFNYPYAEIEVGENGASLCGNVGVPIYVNAIWASIGCDDTNDFPSFLDVEIQGIDNPGYSEVVRLHATSLSVTPGDTWTGSYDAYFGGEILLPPTIFLDPGSYTLQMIVPQSLEECGEIFSASINVAELELSDLYKFGGGLRVAEKITDDANGNTLTSQFDYSDDQGISTGILNSIPDFAGEGGIRITETAVQTNGINNLFFGYQVNITSSSLTPITLMSAPGTVGYSSVTKTYTDQDDNGFGKEVKTFQNEDFSTSRTSTNYAVIDVPRFYNANNGNLINQKIFDENGLKVKETTNGFGTVNWNAFDWIWTGKLMCQDCLTAVHYGVGTSGGQPQSELGCTPPHRLWIVYYSYIPQWHKLESTTEKIWGTDGTGPLITTTNYTYDNDFYVPKSVSVSGGNASTLTGIRYAQDISSQGDPDIYTSAIPDMLSRNMTAIPVWEKTTGSVQSGSKVRYELQNNLIIPSAFFAIEGDINVWEPQYELFYNDYTDDYPDRMLKDAYTDMEIFSWTDGLLLSKSYIDWVQTWGYNNKRQLVYSQNIDGTSASYAYDDLQRLQTANRIGRNATLKSTVAYQYLYDLAGGGGENKIVTTTTFEDGAETQVGEQVFDGMGRNLLTRRLGYTPLGNDKVMQSVDYDGFGRKEQAYSIGQDAINYEYEASPLSRMLQVNNPDGSTVSMIHSTNGDQEVEGYVENTLFKVKTTDENGNISETFSDRLNRTRVNRDHLSPTETADTYYAFNNFGNISMVTTPLQNSYLYQYDAHNRLSDKTIPGGGTSTYEYYPNDLLYITTLSNGHSLYNYYDDYDRLEVTSLDGPESLDNNNIENIYDINHGDIYSAFNGKMTSQRARVLDTDDWLESTLIYDRFGRVVRDISDNYVEGQDISSTGLDYADNIESINRVHSSSYHPDLTINAINTLDHSFRIKEVDHQIDNDPLTKISGLFYDNEDRLSAKQLFGSSPMNDLLQQIDYGYNSRGWLTNINKVDEGATNSNQIEECDTAPQDCYRCDYRAVVNFSGHNQIYAIYVSGGQLVELPGYPYDFDDMAQLEIDLENWLTFSNILYDEVYVEADGDVAYITITQSKIAFINILVFEGQVVHFNEYNCTGTPPGSSGLSGFPAAIKPLRLAIEYNHNELSAANPLSSLVKVTERSKHFKEDETFEIIETNKMEVVITNNVLSSDSPTHIMEIDLSNQWINPNTVNDVLDTLEYLLINELNTAGIVSSTTQAAFVQAIELSVSSTWNTTTSTTLDPAISYGNPDLFSMKLTYGEGAPMIESPAQFNGNISGLTWQVAGRSVQSYSFWYDKLDRLNEGLFKESQGGVYSINNKYGVGMDYDKEGNIQWLKRRGVLDICDLGTTSTSSFTENTVQSGGIGYEYGQIDDLGYIYDYANNNLGSIAETSNTEHGYIGEGGKYYYDGAGNLIEDQNKNMIISYNYLNLPKTITFLETGSTISFKYDALGNKLKKIVNGTVSKDYCNGIEYNEGILEAVYHAEGRVAFEGEDSRYEYYLKDHLGNTRVIFSDLNNDGFLQPFNDGGGATPAFPNGTALYTEILQESHYYPFGMNMEGPWEEVEALPANDYLYNGKELNSDFGLNWLDYGARWYDPSIGRWNAIDPLAEKYYPYSPYNYTLNNPIRFIDPDGRSVETLILGGEIEKSKADVLSLVDEKHHHRISFDSETNIVSFNSEGLANSNFENDSGLTLIRDITTAGEKILYSASDEGTATLRRDGKTRTIDLKSLTFPILNVSKTPNMAFAPSVTTGNPENDGELTISPTTTWQENSPNGVVDKNRASVVFHELQENYERTVNKLLYKYTDGSGKKGAHQVATEKEEKFHKKSNTPGVALNKVISND